MHKIENHTVKTWFIFSNTEGTAHTCSYTEVGEVTESGMDNLETFTVEQEWLDRLNVLGLDFPSNGYTEEWMY